MRSDRERLIDALEAIERIERHSSRGKDVFASDELIQTWVIHHLEILGEACRGLSEGLRNAHSEIPWAKIVGMRNILAHGYFGVDVETVWAVVERDLPALRTNLHAMLTAIVTP